MMKRSIALYSIGVILSSGVAGGDFVSAHDFGGQFTDSHGQSFSPSVAPTPEPSAPVTVDLETFTLFRGDDGTFGGLPGSTNTRLAIVLGPFPDPSNLNVIGLSTNTVDVTTVASSGGSIEFTFDALTLTYDFDYSAILVTTDGADTITGFAPANVLTTNFFEDPPSSGSFSPATEYGGSSFRYSRLSLDQAGTSFNTSDTVDTRFIAEFALPASDPKPFVSAHDAGTEWRDIAGQSFSPSVNPTPDIGAPSEALLRRFTFMRGGGAAASTDTILLIVTGSFPNIANLNILGQSTNIVDGTALSVGDGMVFEFDPPLPLEFASNYSALLFEADTNGDPAFFVTTNLQSTNFVQDPPDSGNFVPASEYGGTSFDFGRLIFPGGTTFYESSSDVDARFTALFDTPAGQSFTLTSRPDEPDIFDTIGNSIRVFGQSFVPLTGAPASANLLPDTVVELSRIRVFSGLFGGIQDPDGSASTRLAIFERGQRVGGQEGNVQERDEGAIELELDNQVVDNANASLFNFITYQESGGAFGFEDLTEAVAVSTNTVDTLAASLGFGDALEFEFDNVPLLAGNAYDAVFVTITGTPPDEVVTLTKTTIAFQEFEETSPGVFEPEAPVGGTNDLNVTALFDGVVFNDGTLRSANSGFDVAFDAAFGAFDCDGDVNLDGSVDALDIAEGFNGIATNDLATGDFDGSGDITADDATGLLSAVANGCD